MKRPVQAVVVIWASVILAGGTVLLCPTVEGPTGPEWQPPLDSLTHVFTLFGLAPAMGGPADLRLEVLPVGLAGLLIVAAWLMWPREPRPSPDVEADSDQPAAPAGPRPSGRSGPSDVRYPGRYVFEILGAATIAVAIASALVNQTWALSSGWILSLACGVGWAVVLGAMLDRRALAPVLVGALVVASVATFATFWHRHLLGIRYVRWPIGPITLTAALGVVWFILGAGLLLRRAVSRWGGDSAGHTGAGPFKLVFSGVGGLGAVLAVVLTVVSNRRAAWLGLAAGLGVAGVIVLFMRWTSRTRRMAVLGVAALAILVAGGWAASQLRDPERVVSGPVQIRLIYWKTIVDELPKKLTLGIGPDMTLCDLTSRLAREHAEKPHVLHGNLVPAAHNEWLQAFYELGLAGGLLYLAMPVWIIVAAGRRCLKETFGDIRAVLLIGAAGLTAIVVNEAASINLRNPIMPVWYWTLIGVTLAAIRSGSGAALAWPSWAPKAEVRSFVSGALAAALFFAISDDLRLAAAHAQAVQIVDQDPKLASEILDTTKARRGAANWLQNRYDRGIALSKYASRISEAPVENDPQKAGRDEMARETAAAASAAWSELVARCPGYPEGVGRLAYALVQAGQSADAAEILAEYLQLQNPYDPSANMLLTEIERQQNRLDPHRQIRSVVRALRAGPMDANLEAGIQGFDWAGPAAQEWPRIVTEAQAELLDANKTEWQNPLAPEALRLEAWRLAQAGQWGPAAAIQRVAAEAYERLEQRSSPVRRVATAEVDAWYRAADYLMQADPSQYRQAYQMILKAERYAVLSMEHEELRHPDRKLSYVGGEVVPMEPPGRYRAMWRLSAMLHVAMGSEASRIRVVYSLAAGAITPEAIDAAQAATAQATVKLLANVPPALRPEHYDQLATFVQQYQAATQAAADQSQTATSQPKLPSP